jgi:Tfp pilus assembly protein PilF
MKGGTSNPRSSGRLSFGFLSLPSVAAFFLACSCWAPLLHGQASGMVQGRVTDFRGRPVSLFVHLLAEGDVPAGDVFTDSNGSFLFNGLPTGTYYVVVEAEGCKPVRQAAMLDIRIQPKVQVNISLEPLTKQPAPTGQFIAGTASSHELNARRPSRPFDPKVAEEYERGNRERQKGDAGAALAHYQKALRMDPNFYPALNNMGTLLERQGRHAEAEEAFLKATEINPDDGEAYINLGHALYEKGEYRAAIDRLDQGLRRSPQSAVGNFLLGSAYFKLQNMEKAEPLLKKACELDPEHMAAARLQLANLYLKRHDNAAARVQLEDYLRTNPSDPQAPAIKKMLADLKAN